MASGWHRKRNDAAAQARAVEYRSPEYRAAEATIAAQVVTGQARCWRCRRPLLAGKDRNGRRLWHVGHDDHDRRVIRGGECPPCNLTAAASKGARVANANRKRRTGAASRTSRDWW